MPVLFSIEQSLSCQSTRRKGFRLKRLKQNDNKTQTLLSSDLSLEYKIERLTMGLRWTI